MGKRSREKRGRLAGGDSNEAETEFERAIAILPDWGQPKSALAQVKALRAGGQTGR